MEKQKKYFGLDFFDIVNFTVCLFKKHENILNKWQERFNYIMVDEFQDTKTKELRLILRLVASGDNLSFNRIINVPRRKMGKNKVAFLREKAEAENASLYDTLKKYLYDGNLMRKCNHSTFYFNMPTVEKLSDYIGLFAEFYPKKK